MLNRKEKIELLRGLANGTRSITELLPFATRMLVQHGSRVYDSETNATVSKEELEEIEKKARRQNHMVLLVLIPEDMPPIAQDETEAQLNKQTLGAIRKF